MINEMPKANNNSVFANKTMNDLDEFMKLIDSNVTENNYIKDTSMRQIFGRRCADRIWGLFVRTSGILESP